MSQIDFNQLEKNFRISLDSQASAILSLSVADLTVEDGALQLIETYGRTIKAPDTATPATAFCVFGKGRKNQCKPTMGAINA